MSDEPKNGYDVGYGKPPKDTQFKKGQPSPNPNGRPKKETSIISAIRAFLGEDVSVTAKDGTRQTMPAANAIGKRVVVQAASGDIGSQRLLLQMEKSVVDRRPTEPEQAAPDPEVDARNQRLTVNVSRMLRITAGCGMFVVDDEYGLCPSDIGAPLMRLYSDLMGSQIRTLADYNEARRNALEQTKQALDAFALSQFRTWLKNIKKSDLE